MTTTVLVLADTHLRPGRRWALPPAAVALLDQVDLVLHAGDVTTAEALRELAGHAPLRAVLGNNDLELRGVLPATRLDVVDGVRVGMVHDSGPRAGRAARLRRRFPDADVVVFGHSHQPLDEVGIDGQRLFNPGSPTDTRGQPQPTVGLLTFDAGAVVEHRLVALDRS